MEQLRAVTKEDSQKSGKTDGISVSEARAGILKGTSRNVFSTFNTLKKYISIHWILWSHLTDKHS